MNIQYRNQSYEVDPCTFIVRGDTLYARIELAARVPMTVYVKVEPQQVWLGLANYLLAMAKQKVDVRIAIAASELGIAA
jgi:hypothetical protein